MKEREYLKELGKKITDSSARKEIVNEYEAHIKDKKCPAGECTALVTYKIDKNKCVGCTLCARNCPVSAISGTVKKPHEIDSLKCIKCGKCKENCRFGAIEVL